MTKRHSPTHRTTDNTNRATVEQLISDGRTDITTTAVLRALVAENARHPHSPTHRTLAKVARVLKDYQISRSDAAVIWRAVTGPLVPKVKKPA